MTSATGLRSLLHECGFSTDSYYSQRRVPSVIFVNLVTPWGGSAGKTSINLKPYEDLIAKTVSSLAYKIPSLKGRGIKTTFDTGLGGIYRPFLRAFLKERKAAIDADPSLLVNDRLTQSGVWYRIRPRMLAAGFRPRNKLGQNNKGEDIYDWNTTRNGLTSSINEVIKEIWDDESVTRESLGIIAKARAMLYFNDQVYPVTFDSKEELARVGTTDMVIVEKEGVTDVLLEAAKKYRIALVATAGKFVEYVKDLMKLADDAGINVCVMTDFDIDGINMWRQANEKMRLEIKRIGITRDVVTWLQNNNYEIDITDVEEEYQPNPALFEDDDDPYLLSKRIELDNVIQKVGADAFWKYIVYQLEKEFPDERDYREIVPEPKPEDYYPDELNQIIDYLSGYTKHSYSSRLDEIKEKELKEVKGLLQVEEKKEEIDKILEPVVAEDDGMKVIVTKLKELMGSGALPKIPDPPTPPAPAAPTEIKSKSKPSSNPETKDIHDPPSEDDDINKRDRQ